MRTKKVRKQVTIRSTNSARICHRSIPEDGSPTQISLGKSLGCNQQNLPPAGQSSSGQNAKPRQTSSQTNRSHRSGNSGCIAAQGRYTAATQQLPTMATTPPTSHASTGPACSDERPALGDYEDRLGGEWPQDFQKMGLRPSLQGIKKIRRPSLVGWRPFLGWRSLLLRHEAERLKEELTSTGLLLAHSWCEVSLMPHFVPETWRCL